MPQDARISTRIDAELKEQADGILAELGLKPSQAISLFYAQIVRHRGIPFDLKLPNAETQAAIDEAKSSEFAQGSPRFSSVDALFSDLDE